MLKDYKVFLNPKTNTFQFAIFLLLFSIVALLSNVTDFPRILDTGANRTFYDAIYIFIILNFIFFVYIYLAKRFLGDKFINPLNIYITTLILFLVLHPTLLLSIILVPLTLIITIISNKFIRSQGQPIFNPAALGIFLSFLLFYFFNLFGILSESLFVSWWGTNVIKGIPPFTTLQIFTGLLWIAILLYLGWKNKKIVYGSAFIVVFVLIQAVLKFLGEPGFDLMGYLIGYLGGNLFFLGLVMLIEPKTSPTSTRQQLVFGIAAAILYSILIVLFNTSFLSFMGNITEIVIILLMNLVFLLNKKFRVLV